MKNKNIMIFQPTTARKELRMSKKLTKFEKRVNGFIKKHGEMLTPSVPMRMMG